MKSIILAICLVFSLNIFGEIISRDIQGSWKIDNTVYTFEQDTLYIDEINVEGETYTYYIKDSIIYAKSIFGDLIKFKIANVNNKKLKLIYFTEDYTDSFTLSKVDNYCFIEDYIYN